MADLQGTSHSHGRTPCVAHPVQAALRDISTNSVSFPNEGFAHAFNRPAEVVDHSTSAHRCSLAAERGHRGQPEVPKCSYQRSRRRRVCSHLPPPRRRAFGGINHYWGYHPEEDRTGKRHQGPGMDTDRCGTLLLTGLRQLLH